MSTQIHPISERQLELLTKAHADSQGLIEPHLQLKGGVKLRTLGFLSQRGLIAQSEGQWRITPAAEALIEGGRSAKDTPCDLTRKSAIAAPSVIHPDFDGAAAAATASCQAVKAATIERLAQIDTEEKPNRRDGSKQAQVIEMLRRPEGVTIAQISEATGWQAHTVRGTFAGALKKKLGLNIVSEKIEGPEGTPGAGQRFYRIALEVQA